MRTVKFWFISASIFGFLSVGLGAFGSHSLKTVLDEYGTPIYEKAVLYQMFHTFALFLVGVLNHIYKKASFSLAGWAFLVGIVLFSGSLYVLAVTHVKWLGFVTPIGGVAFLFGWLCLLWTLSKRHS